MENLGKMTIMRSAEFKDLVAALCKAQSVMKPAVFNKTNPHFKNKYADFASCMECCREPLTSNGLAVMQYPTTIDGKLTLVTLLAHTSGQWIESHFPLNPMKNDSQSIGSAMSYGKRYCLSSLVGIVSEDDDDGEAAHGRHIQNGTNYQAKAPIVSGNVTYAAPAAKQKISLSQVGILRSIDIKLDHECRNKIYSWLAVQHKINKLEDVTTDMYEKVLIQFENALKFVEQNKLEAVQV